MDAKPVTIPVEPGASVSGLLMLPPSARACLVFAHGAGAGMKQSFMSTLAQDLAARGIASLRYQFPYMESGSKRPDPPKTAHATVRAAVLEASRLAPGLTLFAGGKSFGGRMTSQAQAISPLPGVRGIAFVGFPLHPAGKPGTERADHLFDVRVPMLFLQGERDALARLDLLRPLVEQLGGLASLVVLPDADHAFHVPQRASRSDAMVMAELADVLANWMRAAMEA